MEQQERAGYEVFSPGKERALGFHVRSHFKYAVGWQIFCDDCHKPCHSTMSYYPCRGEWLVDRIKCRLGCGKVWRLEIDCEKLVCH